MPLISFVKMFQNIDDFFSKRGVSTLGIKSSFELLTFSDAHGPDDADFLQLVQQRLDNPLHDKTEQDAAFKESFIPQTLFDVPNAERDVAQIHAGQGQNLLYAKATGVLADAAETVDSASEDSSSDSHSSNSDSESDGNFDKTPRGHKFEDKDSKKERKNAVKEANRERRKAKMPKAQKQRLVAKQAAKRK